MRATACRSRYLPSDARSRTGVPVIGGPQHRGAAIGSFASIASSAQSGIASMRFDYRGIGDSEGERRTLKTSIRYLRSDRCTPQWRRRSVFRPWGCVMALLGCAPVCPIDPESPAWCSRIPVHTEATQAKPTPPLPCAGWLNRRSGRSSSADSVAEWVRSFLKLYKRLCRGARYKTR
jgi:hypothetical protein